MTREEMQLMSFQIISYAGDAFSSFAEAINKAKLFDFDESDRLLQYGRKQLTYAHKSQTELLTSEANKEELPFSVIMVHAQDHLMNAVMYEKIAEEFVNLYKDKKEWNGNHA